MPWLPRIKVVGVSLRNWHQRCPIRRHLLPV